MRKVFIYFIACLLWAVPFHISPHAALCVDKLTLNPVDKVVLLELHGDNNYPVGQSDALVSRLGDIRYTGKQEPPLEARGMGILVEIFVNGKKRTILFDAGSRGDVMRNNFSYFEKDPSATEAIVISHGHSDHFGGLPEAIKMIHDDKNNKKVPIYVGSEAAFETRYFRQKNGELKGPWRWPKDFVELLNGDHIVGGPSLLLDGYALYTGPIPSLTSFENINLDKKKGWCKKDSNGKVKMIDMPEESALVLNVKNKGLVVISGCTHRGTINTLRYAQQLTGIDSIYARFGSYPNVDSDKLVNELKSIKPAVFIGAHCSPNKPDLMNTLKATLPKIGGLYYQSVIGSEFTFQ
jgi:7,8-dihydropterin-6-yl-methyl-4-(beta-D-ribofuranosyl)aminobenzene 5'-phosphate synthase